MSKQAKTLNEQELKKLLQAATNTKHPARNRTILLLTHLAGMRVGEVAAVKLGDVMNGEGQVLSQIQLKADQTKGSESRTVLLNERMQEVLRNYIHTLKNNHRCRESHQMSPSYSNLQSLDINSLLSTI